MDSVHEVLAATPRRSRRRRRSFAGSMREYLKGLVRRDGLLIIFLDVARVLTSSELLELTSAAATNG